MYSKILTDEDFLLLIPVRETSNPCFLVLQGVLVQGYIVVGIILEVYWNLVLLSKKEGF